MLPLCILIISVLPFYVSLPACFALTYLVQNVLVSRFLLHGRIENMQSTPLVASICQATLFYDFITWLKMIPCNYNSFCVSLSRVPHPHYC
jgi:hypothetical protein